MGDEFYEEVVNSCGHTISYRIKVNSRTVDVQGNAGDCATCKKEDKEFRERLIKELKDIGNK